MLALALLLFLVIGLPLLGWAVVAVAWVAQRWIVATAKRRAFASGDRARVMRAVGLSMLIRLVVVTASVAVVGIADRDTGLPAAILAAVLFSTALVLQLAAPTPPGAQR